jgi:hypothetical protein
MNIDNPTMKVAMELFESMGYGNLYELDLSKRERRSLLRYNKLPRRALDNYRPEEIEELLNISYEFKQILNKVMKPRYRSKQ